MATTAMDYESTNPDRFEDDGPRYDRQRSASPRGTRDDDGGRRRSASPIGNSDLAPKDGNSSKGDDESINPGSNLFVTGISPSLSEEEVTLLFQKYGDVEKCQIMRDPHSKESRGFGFVKMVTPEQADNARDGLNGEMLEGRSLSIEKARRARPRTPTPGKYFGPPKRDPRPGGGRFDRYDDRRRGYSGGYGGGGYRDDPYRYRGGGDRRDYDRGYDRGYERSYDRGYDRDHDRRDYDRGYERRDRDDGYSRGPGGDRYGSGGRGGGERGDRAGGDRAGGDRAGGERGDRDRYGPARGGSNYERSYDRDRGYERDGPRSRDPPAGNSYADAGPRSDAREPYGGSHY